MPDFNLAPPPPPPFQIRVCISKAEASNKLLKCLVGLKKSKANNTANVVTDLKAVDDGRADVSDDKSIEIMLVIVSDKTDKLSSLGKSTAKKMFDSLFHEILRWRNKQYV